MEADCLPSLSQDNVDDCSARKITSALMRMLGEQSNERRVRRHLVSKSSAIYTACVPETYDGSRAG